VNRNTGFISNSKHMIAQQQTMWGKREFLIPAHLAKSSSFLFSPNLNALLNP
jgi:hypothetical protein